LYSPPFPLSLIPCPPERCRCPPLPLMGIDIARNIASSRFLISGANLSRWSCPSVGLATHPVFAFHFNFLLCTNPAFTTVPFSIFFWVLTAAPFFLHHVILRTSSAEVAPPPLTFVPLIHPFSLIPPHGLSLNAACFA